MNYLEIAISVIGVLLMGIAGDYYRRLFMLKGRVKQLEDKMVALGLADTLQDTKMDYMKERVEQTHEGVTRLNDTLVPSLNALNTQVALIADRLKTHIEGDK